MNLEGLSPKQKKELLEALRAREIVRCKESFEYFLFKYVRTKDEKSPLSPVKPVPEKAYLRFLAKEFQHGPDVQYVAKSRQLMVSWLLCAYSVWKAMFQPHALVCFQSKKLEDAARMVFDTTPNVARCSFIMANLPPWLKICLQQEGDEQKPVPFPADNKMFSYGSIKLPNGSIVEALAQGPAQVEGKVPSLYIGDEASLQDEWRQAQAAVIPCISNGGKALTVGTMRMPSAYGEEIAPADEVDADSEFRGVARFRSKDGVAGIRVHYSADPAKDPATSEGAAWFAEEISRMPGGYEGTDWQQHMEICPQAVTGDRVLPMWFKIADRVVIDDIPIEHANLWRLDAGFDFGLRNRTEFIVFATDFEGVRYVLSEVSVVGNTVDGINGIAVLMKANPYFQRVNGRIHADPSLWNKEQNTKAGLVSRAQLFADLGVRLVPARVRGREADDVLLNRLLGPYWGGHDDMDTFEPRLFICRSCTGVTSTLPKLMYAEWRAEHTDKKEQIQSKNADAWDAMKYAEVARPSSAVLPRTQEPPMSFEWYRKILLKEQNKVKYARS
jgi:hypothetical protein